MHISLSIGKNNVLMANDVPDIMGRTNENENRLKIVLSAESREEADKVFNGLSQAEILTDPLATVPGILTPECLETSMALNGSRNLTQTTVTSSN